MGGLDKQSETASVGGNQVVTLNLVFDEIAKLAIVTLDTDPRGVDKVKNLPVGKFVRLNDVRSIMEKFINSSLAVSERK
jgi:hypothetical protein